MSCCFHSISFFISLTVCFTPIFYQMEMKCGWRKHFGIKITILLLFWAWWCQTNPTIDPKAPAAWLPMSDGPNWNISTDFGWIAMNVCTDINSHQGIHSHDFADPLTFPLSSSWVWHFWFWINHLNNNWKVSHDIWYKTERCQNFVDPLTIYAAPSSGQTFYIVHYLVNDPKLMTFSSASAVRFVYCWFASMLTR